MHLAAGIRRQRGQAFVAAVLLLAIGASAVVYYLTNPAATTLRQDEQTAAALAQAKTALIGHAASHATRPGALPCPDTNDDGNGESPSPNCPSYLGRLPWKSLGLPDIRDGDGERLWYALSPNYRNLNPPSGPILNPETAGQISVDAAGAVVAVVIAPGVVVAAQSREGAGALSAANFLEGGNENGGTSYTYTTGNSATSNDRLMAITRDQLMPPVEFRVAREVRTNLQQYYTTNGYYPFASGLSGTTCSNNTFQGRLPVGGCTPASGVTLAGVTLPAWFTPNEWYRTVIYAAAPRCTPKIDSTTTTTTSWFLWLLNLGGCIDLSFILPPPFNFLCPLTTTTTTYAIDPAALNCNNTTAGSPAGSWLTVDSTSNIESILLPAGPGLGTQVRSCTNLANCLEDAANTDGNYIFTQPRRTPTNNDNLVVVRP